MENLNSIFKEEKRLIDLNDFELTQIEELNLIASELERNSKVNFINWRNSQSFLDENNEIKSRIQTQLVSNLLDDKNNELIIDLSEYEIDIDFLTKLSNKIRENTASRVGQVILGKRNQELFGESECWTQLRSCVSERNSNFQRYSSDAVHCMLASYCRNLSNNVLWLKLEQSGWKIENELNIPDHDYHSILFRNDSTRNFLLAFRGLTFDFDECFTKSPQDTDFLTKLSQKLTNNCYYAYLHARASFELSEKMNFWLSFTGHGFGAWLAELSVLHCYRENGTTRVRAVTFDSPGSGEIFYRLDDTEDFNEILDITTYLSCPNLVNTSSADHKSIYDHEFADFTKPPHHLGTVFFINDLYTEKTLSVREEFLIDILEQF